MLKAREALTKSPEGMTKSLTATKPAVVDPAAERAEFFAHLELLELTMVVPQAAAIAEPINKY
jgi:hypothetical protein